MFNELNINRKLKVIKFGGDSIPNTNAQTDLKNIIEECDDLYPGIDIWFKKKVRPGFKNKDRIAFLIYHNEKPTGAAIIKKGKILNFVV